MTSLTNDWISRFEPLLDKGEIYKRALMQPEKLEDLNSLPIEVAATSIKIALQSVFYPTTQNIEILYKWAQDAYSYNLNRYPDSKYFFQRLYAKKIETNIAYSPICFTGYAGIGKTELIKAFQRIQQPDSYVDPGSGHGVMPLKNLWSIDINVRTSPSNLLLGILGDETNNIGNIGVTDLIGTCQKTSYRYGISLLFADEFQFVNQGSANAKVTQLLLLLNSVGVPLIYAANFSLIERLQKRNQEDRQRLLGNPIILMPDSPSSEDWKKTVACYLKVLPDKADLNLENDASYLHNYTAGIKRALVVLLVSAYKVARGNGIPLNMKAIEEAYLSAEYSTFRDDAQAIARQVIQQEKQKGRKDLWCSLDIFKDLLSTQSEPFSEKRAELVASEKLLGSMTPLERAQITAIKKIIPKTPLEDTPDNALSLIANNEWLMRNL